MAGYSRQSVADIIANAVIKAAPVNAEYNAIRDAFAFSGGHKHDGSSTEGSYVPLIADTDALNKVVVDTANNRISFYSEVGGSAVEQVRIQDGAIVPVTDNDIDLGSSGFKFKNLYVDGIGEIGSITVLGGTIDNTVIGGTTPAAGDFTNVGLTGDLNVTGATSLTGTTTATTINAENINASTGFTGDLTGDVVGNVTGNLTGNVTGNVTSSGTSTFATVDVNGGAIDGTTIGLNSASTGAFTNLSASGTTTITTADINGGAIDGTTIGAAFKAAGSFTTVTTTGQATLPTVNIDGGTIDGTTIGNTTPASGAFTTVSSSGGITGDVTGNLTGNVTGNVTGAVTGNVTGDLTGNVNATTGSSTFNNMTVNGTIDVTGTAIVNVTDPTNAQDAATKNYVDTNDALKLNLSGGTMSGAISMGNNKVTNVATPTASSDAANKGYVDQEVSALVDAAPGTLDTLNELAAALGDDPDFATTVTDSIATKLPLAGGTMSGDISMGSNAVTSTANPTTDDELARKGYVDAQDATKLNLSGGTMSGEIAMGSNKITGVTNPTANQDAATKAYVDTQDGLQVSKSGDTMSGNLAMGSNKITGLATPTSGTDATNKTYVDGILESGELASASAAAAATSESNAASSASAAANSASAAATSEANADTSEANALTYSSNAATSAAQAASSAAGIAGYDLDVIAETKGVTAVDVFVYDTSKDSDGGAWRKRTQGTSWYNEALNTATRGSRREFPAVAVIVAESGKVTIYDGDDPDLPMWMVFEGNTFHVNGKLLQADGGRPVRSVMMLNGLFTYAVDSEWVSYGQISFISEDVKLDYLSGQRFAVATRNDPLTQNIGGDFSKNFAEGNDVAMTVLPNAPIDAATGLPVPTIAVATDGGLSVIKDDGTVVDSIATASISHVAFSKDNRIFTSTSTDDIVNSYLTYASDGFAHTARYSDGGGSPSLIIPTSYTLGQAKELTGIDNTTFATAKDGVFIIDEDTTTPANGMVAYTTSTYNTGWMNGDIKGAFLSDTDTTNLVGSGELISNGGFDDDYGTFGWQPYNYQGYDVYITQTASGLKVENGASGGVAAAYQVIDTTVGETYVIKLDVVASDSTPRLLVRTISPAGPKLLETHFTDGVGTYTGTFTATTTTAYVVLSMDTIAANSSTVFDNISVKLADADRSVNNNGLVVSSKTYDPWHDDLNLAFDDESFTVDREASDFMSAITHDASSNATMTGGYGPELVTNGDFSDGSTGWTTSGDSEIVNGQARIYTSDGSLSKIEQSNILEVGKTYELSFRVANLVSGNVIEDADGSRVFSIPSEGEYKFIFTAVAQRLSLKRRGSTDDIYIDNISVREMPQVQWRPHNLLRYSEDLTSDAWYKTATTVTANAAVAPDGTTTADEFSHTSSTADLRNFSDGVVSGATFVTAVFVKYVDNQWFRIQTELGSVWADVQNGVIGSAQSGITGSIEDFGSGWYLVTATRTATTTSLYTTVLLAPSDGAFIEAVGTSAYIWGAHLYRSDLGGMAPVPTDLQTASSTTYVRTAGREVTGTELVTNGTFASDTSGWTAGGGGTLSIESSTLKILNDSDGNSYAYQSVTTEVGKIYKVSYEVVERNTNARLSIYSGGSEVAFDYSAGVSSITGTFSVTFTATSTASEVRLWNYSPDASVYNRFDNISVKEIDVDPSTARYLPRLGHHVYNGSAWVNEGLLHESEARTNFMTNSETFDTWNKNNTSVSANTAVAPDGTLSADKLYKNNTTNQAFVSRAISAATGDLTFTFYVKSAEYDTVGFTLYNATDSHVANGSANLTNGTTNTSAGTIGIEDIGNGWWRIRGSGTATASNSVLYIYPKDSTSYQGDGSSGVYLWGAQVEVGSTPSSYIPTSGSTATRASESLTIPAANLPYSSTAMTIQMDGRVTYADEGVFGTVRPLEWLVSNSNKLAWELSTNSTDQGRFVFLQDSSSVRDVVTTNTDDYLPDVLVPFNLSSRYTSTALNASIDGVALTANTTPTSLPDLSSADLNIGTPYNGTIRNFRMWGNDIKDDGIEIVTQPSIAPSLSLSFDGSEASHVEFDWSEK